MTLFRLGCECLNTETSICRDEGPLCVVMADTETVKESHNFASLWECETCVCVLSIKLLVSSWSYWWRKMSEEKSENQDVLCIFYTVFSSLSKN